MYKYLEFQSTKTYSAGRADYILAVQAYAIDLATRELMGQGTVSMLPLTYLLFLNISSAVIIHEHSLPISMNDQAAK